MRKPSEGSGPIREEAGSTRDRIRAVAADLYVRRGHDGFSFGDIADAVGITRANIHHHFGNKQKLMGELIEGFAADAEIRIGQIWTGEGRSFRQRLKDQLEDFRRFHDRYNPAPGDRNVWSPISRLRLDLPVLGDEATAALKRINRRLENCLTPALEEAVRQGELAPDTPVADIAGLVRVMLLAVPPVTQDSASFDEIEKVFGALDRMVSSAWGRRAEGS